MYRTGSNCEPSERVDSVDLLRTVSHSDISSCFLMLLEPDLGNSGIKFEVEGEGGSTGADTYIPLQKSGTFFLHFSQKITILQHFSEIFRKIINAAFWENPEKNWSKFSKSSAKFWQHLRTFVKNQQKVKQFLTKT